MRTELPRFKYHPNPLRTEVIIERESVCRVCNTKTNYVYTGPFFSVDEVEDICPWCISNGSAAKKYDGEFQDAASVDDGYSLEQLDELIHKTPGYVAWQQAHWLRHCNDFCAFVGYVGWKDIKNISAELLDDFEHYGYSLGELERQLINGGSLQAYLFKCLDCGKHRIHFDCD
jgi:uncharacterized protein CbrC (UPF0167 family)